MKRTVSVVALSALALVSLTGCVALPEGPEPKPTDTTEAAAAGFAEIGDCWETNYSDMADWSVWEGDGPIDCDEEHQSYTYFVGPMTASVEDAWDDGGISAELASAVSGDCRAMLRELGVPEDAARASLFFFVTPEDDWVDGDQRFRCDVAVSALDSDWRAPGLEQLPTDIADLVDDIDQYRRSYELCLIGDGYGPYESTEASFADCAGEYYWRFSGRVEYPSADADPVPTVDELYAFANSECAALGLREKEATLPYVPSEEMWDAGNRSITCWTSLLVEPSTPI